MAPIYVTGHRHPDTDSVASAIGYAELKRRLDPANDYVPVRLGELNAQTTWVLARAGPLCRSSSRTSSCALATSCGPTSRSRATTSRYARSG